ncbi:hypothetical protein AA313_de0204129 [Arthrobotrys entomopaga]|nr:hypothetical protein AA313_de0204129 [Arthrobotrys entomopaga]
MISSERRVPWLPCPKHREPQAFDHVLSYESHSSNTCEFVNPTFYVYPWIPSKSNSKIEVFFPFPPFFFFKDTLPCFCVFFGYQLLSLQHWIHGYRMCAPNVYGRQ